MNPQGPQAPEDNRLGAILVRAGALDAEGLSAALGSQAAGQRLGEHLVQLGLTSSEAIDAALKEQLRDARLGQILIRIGAITMPQLATALDAQLATGRMLGELLVEEGAMVAETLDWALSQQSGEKRTGAMFVRRGLLNPEQLERCFQMLSLAPDRQLTEIMVEEGYLSAEQVRETLRLKLQEVRLGAILLEMGALSPEQLQFAMAEQTVSGSVLGQVLIQLGFCDVRALSSALARQLMEKK